MINLAATTDKLQLVTDAAVAVDVHASYVDLASGNVTPGRQNTAISTATTTDIVGAPGSSTFRNVKFMTVRNKGASPVGVTVVVDQNGTDYELRKATLLPGEELLYMEGFGWAHTSNAVDAVQAALTSDTVANATDTYLTELRVPISGRIKAGSFFKFKLKMSKTAAGTATPIFNVRVGTNGSVSDTARVTHTLLAQTAAADDGWAELLVTVRNVSATGVIASSMLFCHRLTTTGLANAAQEQILSGTSATFDLTAAGLFLGLSVNPGASGVWTFQAGNITSDNLLN